MTDASPTTTNPTLPSRGDPEPTADAVLVVDGLVKRYADAIAVDHVSFDVRAGEVYGLLGPNGAGKTTTLGVVAGLVRADAGSVRVAGHAIERDPVPAQRALGVVPQALALYPDLTVRQNLGYFILDSVRRLADEGLAWRGTASPCGWAPPRPAARATRRRSRPRWRRSSPRRSA